MFNFLPRIIHIGALNLQLYGITLSLGVVVGVIIARQLALEKGLNPDSVIDFTVISLISSLLSARLVFVLQNLHYYLIHPVMIPAVWLGGLSFHGGILGGFIAALWFIRRRKFSFWRWADIIAPGLAIGEAIGRIGCDLYGKPVSESFLPLIINGVRYANVPIFTGVSSLIIFLILMRVRKNSTPGVLFPLYILLYSIARFFIEFIRQNSMIGLLTLGQWVSLVLIAVSGLTLYYLIKIKKSKIRDEIENKNDQSPVSS